MAIDPEVAADPERFMRLAIEAARAAETAGDIPSGAVAVRDGVVIATAGNRRAIDNDPTATRRDAGPPGRRRRHR